jgi:type I site-specific restriction-modification system R (restriction) subunit
MRNSVVRFPVGLILRMISERFFREKMSAMRRVYTASSPILDNVLKRWLSVPDRERGGQNTERLRVMDWEQPANNDFLLVSQFSVTGARGKCRMTSFDRRTD